MNTLRDTTCLIENCQIDLVIGMQPQQNIFTHLQFCDGSSMMAADLVHRHQSLYLPKRGRLHDCHLNVQATYSGETWAGCH